jgi:GDP-D-mannose dehydratase
MVQALKESPETVLITGQDGPYLAEFLLRKGLRIQGFRD